LIFQCSVRIDIISKNVNVLVLLLFLSGDFRGRLLEDPKGIIKDPSVFAKATPDKPGEVGAPKGIIKGMIAMESLGEQFLIYVFVSSSSRN